MMAKKSCSPPVRDFNLTRRKLPHWQNPGSVYFITWNCKKPQLLAEPERSITMEAIRFSDRRQWLLYSAVVMPDHVHLMAQPLPITPNKFYSLGQIIKSVKSYSSRRINGLRIGTRFFWQVERYDRIVRDEAEFLEKWHYIRNNPVKAELRACPEEYPWLYEIPETGAEICCNGQTWRFVLPG